MSDKYTFIIEHEHFRAQIEILEPETVAILEQEPDRVEVAEALLRLGIISSLMDAMGSSATHAEAMQRHLVHALKRREEITGGSEE